MPKPDGRSWLEELGEGAESSQELDHVGLARAMVRLCILLCVLGGYAKGSLCSALKVITWRRTCVGEETVAGDQLEVVPDPGKR